MSWLLPLFAAVGCSLAARLCLVDANVEGTNHTEYQYEIACSNDCEYCVKFEVSQNKSEAAALWGCGCGSVKTFLNKTCLQNGYLRTEGIRMFCCLGDLCNGSQAVGLACFVMSLFMVLMI